MTRKPGQAVTSRRTAARGGRAKAGKAGLSRRKGQARRDLPEGPPAGRGGWGHPVRWLVWRIDRIDWRYKVQLTVGFCLGTIVAMYLLRDRIVALGDWGYLGAFIINGVSNATIVLPAPGGAVIAIMAQDFDPLLIGIAAGLGGTLGGSTAYIAGLVNSGGAKKSRWFRRLSRLMGRIGGAVIFTFALIPIMPGDFASLVAGAVRYRFHKYLIYNGIGSMIKMSVIAYMGADFLSRLEIMVSRWLHSLF